MSNGPARSLKLDQKLFDTAEKLGDPFEISIIRRDEFNVVISTNQYEDIIQSKTLTSPNVPRGHQYPAAFLIMGSGLDRVINKIKHTLPRLSRQYLFLCFQSMINRPIGKYPLLTSIYQDQQVKKTTLVIKKIIPTN